MLDADTKRRIDTARDILVGKIPDPKSQVEQITLALIYKFMDDMDAQAEELGGQREFFAGEFAQYGWAKLMRSGLGGQEKLNLYSDAIAQIPQNPDLPPLFRAIFSNAFLPYRDPETLMLFLEVIDGFSYGDSENLGDAYEYLLSVLGVQGDAGQFRTPRHIIDFIVAVVNPQKTETILDPACGTAGFLISAWQHIRQANTDDRGGDTLTPAERHRLAANLLGYDISPDFVRLSRVNMYLHGFAEPHIVEYDTLTSQERWDQYADVIITNPPFMSPRGGIQPHNRFSVQSRRSEVLFVGYIAEHLKPQGRAGVIVPEGVIFQTGNAYKQLRKMLVDDYLAAVISLPGGVFQPYSGVKTSILILDKNLADQADTVAFFKVERDGFDLGAQRRPIDQDDLPAVQSELQEYLRRLRAGESLADFAPQTGLVVDKAKLAAGGEYNLSGERYRESRVSQSNFPVVSLGEISEVIAGQSPPGDSYNTAGIGAPFYQGKTEFGEMFLGEPVKWTTEPKRFAEGGDVLMSVRAPVGPVNLATERVSIGRGLAAIRPKSDRLMTLYAYYVLRSLEAKITGSAGASFASINKGEIESIQIPLPPLSVQEEIVAEVAGYQRVIDGARAVADNWRPRVDIDPSWPVVALGECCVVNPKKSELGNLDGETKVSFVPMADMGENAMYFVPKDHKQLKDVGSSYTYFRDSDVLVARVTPCFENGKAGIARDLANGIGFGSSEFHVLRPDSAAISQWIYLCIAAPNFRAYAIPQMTGTGGLQRVPRDVVERYKIPLPPLRVQEELVAGIEEERRRAVGAGELAGMLEERVRGAVGRVWG